MIAKTKLSFLFILTVTMLAGCSESSPTSPSASDNLLSNPSFESNGSPSLQSWSRLHINTNVFSFSYEVPPGGGKYSVAINATWGPPYTISQTVPVTPGDHRYDFSAWAKKVGFGGQLQLHLKRADSLQLLKSARVTDTTWAEYSIIDAISIENGDSLRAAITGGFSQLQTGTSYFDLCVLKQLE